MNREELLFSLENNIPKVEGRDVWIWGTGHTAQLYQEGLKRIDKFNICGYCDNAVEKWGKEIGGKPIISPEQLRQYQDICVLICSPQEIVVSTVGHQLDIMGIKWYRIDEAVFKLYRAEVLMCYDLLDDQLSKDTYAHIIDCRMKDNMPEDSYISENQYFSLRQFRSYGQEKETFIDCGAFTGDTIEQYIWKKYAAFNKIIAFEPDVSNFHAMECRVDRLEREWNLAKEKIELYCCGVGKESSSISMMQNGNMGSALGEFFDAMGNSESITDVKVIALDDFLKEPYSFLKADIEGYEYNMIEGAQNGIKKYKPLLAICIYHNAIDLFDIQLLIHQLVPEYKFAVRHHSITFDETILYAYL